MAGKSCPPSALPTSRSPTPASAASTGPHVLLLRVQETAGSAPVGWRAHSTLHNSGFDLRNAAPQPAVCAPPAAQTIHGYSIRADMRRQCYSTQPATALVQHHSVTSSRSQAVPHSPPARPPPPRGAPPTVGSSLAQTGPCCSRCCLLFPARSRRIRCSTRTAPSYARQ